MSDWTTIETAPHDGSIVDLLHAGGSVFTEEWWAGDPGWAGLAQDYADGFTHWRPAIGVAQ